MGFLDANNVAFGGASKAEELPTFSDVDQTVGVDADNRQTPWIVNYPRGSMYIGRINHDIDLKPKKKEAR